MVGFACLAAASQGGPVTSKSPGQTAGLWFSGGETLAEVGLERLAFEIGQFEDWQVCAKYLAQNGTPVAVMLELGRDHCHQFPGVLQQVFGIITVVVR